MLKFAYSKQRFEELIHAYNQKIILGLVLKPTIYAFERYATLHVLKWNYNESGLFILWTLFHEPELVFRL